MNSRLLHATVVTRLEDLRRAADSRRVGGDAARHTSARSGRFNRHGLGLRSLRARVA
jgi:hypothetical protein